MKKRKKKFYGSDAQIDGMKRGMNKLAMFFHRGGCDVKTDDELVADIFANANKTLHKGD